MFKKLTYFLVPLLLLIFYLRIVSTIKVKSDTYDEMKCLKAGEYLASGSGWVVEASVFHPPLSYYIHGFLLKDSNFKNDDEKIYYARLIMAVFSVILGFFIFKYAKEKFGELSGLLALFLFTFCPNIIAYSPLIVQDMLVTLFIFLGFYSYEKSLEKIKDTKRIILAGLVFGLALLSKYTGVFLIPIYIFMGLTKILFPAAVILSDSEESKKRKAILKKDNIQNVLTIGKLVKQLVLICIIGLFVLNLGYKFTGSFKSLKRFSFESSFFTKLSQTPVLSSIPVPVPAPFLYGFDIQKHITESGHPTFLMGERSLKGWWYYFIIAFLIKVPIPLIILLVMAISIRNKGKLNLIIPILSLTLPFILFTNSNPGIRYLLPIFPFLYIYVSDLANSKKMVFNSILWLLIGWFAVGSIIIHPHYLAYFNEFIGGPKNGYKYLADSNIDWGQDRFLVIKFLQNNPDVIMNPIEPSTGRFLINANNLNDVFAIQEKHKWLKLFNPIGNIGYSWLLYDVKQDDYKKLLEKNPQDYYLNYVFGFITEDMKYLQKSVELNPTFIPSRLKIGQLLLKQDNNFNAISEFKEILKENPENPDAMKHMLEINNEIGNLKTAKEYEKKYKIAKILNSYVVYISTDENYYKNRIEKDPKNAKLWNNLGFIYWIRNDFDKSVYYFKKATELNPNYVDFIGNLAVIYKEKGMQKEYQELKNEYRQKYNLITSARVSQIQYGEDKMILEDIFILPLE